MAKIKYELVASIYDKHVWGEKYSKEEVVALENIALDSLESIDAFTCCYSKENLIAELKENYKDKNMFSIRVTKGKNFFFLPTIFDQPDLVEVINSIKKKDVMTRDGYQTYKVIYSSNPLVQKVTVPIREAIYNKDLPLLSSCVDETSQFYHHVKRYIQSDEHDHYEFENLGLEVRNYQTFRANMLYQKKLAEVRNHYSFQSAAFSKNPKKLVALPMGPATEIKFGTDYAQAKTLEYNQRNEEKEEFLDENEVAQITGYNDEFSGSTIKGESSHARR